MQLVFGVNLLYIAPNKQISMSTIRKSITFTTKQDSWIRTRIKNGDFTNDSEYIRDLVRKDQEKHQKMMDLKYAIDEGLQSGKSNLKVNDIMRMVDNGEL